MGLLERLISQKFFYPLVYLFGLTHSLLYQGLEFFSGCRVHIHPAFFGLGQKLRVLHRFGKGLAQDVQPLWRSARGDNQGSTKFTARQNDLNGRRLNSGVLY